MSKLDEVQAKAAKALVEDGAQVPSEKLLNKVMAPKPKTPGKKAKATAKALKPLTKTKKDAPGPRKCATCKKAPPKGLRSLRCASCHSKVKSARGLVNNVKWRQRVANGKPSLRTYVVYAGKPTTWALKNPAKAIELAKKKGLKVEDFKAKLKTAARTLASAAKST